MTKSNTLKSTAIAFALAIACVAQASAAEPRMKIPAQAAVVHTASGSKAQVLNRYDDIGQAWGQRGQERDIWGHRGDYYGPMVAMP